MTYIFYWLIKLAIGGGIYYTLEIIARGRSHWTMFLLGGLCFISCGIIHNISSGQLAIWQEMVWCMIVITLLELVFGIVLNGFLSMNIWDYSGMPFHILGQICVPFMLLWYFISFPAILLNTVCDYFLRLV